MYFNIMYVISVNLEVPSDFSDYTFTVTTKPPNLIAMATNLLGGNGDAVKLSFELRRSHDRHMTN